MHLHDLSPAPGSRRFVFRVKDVTPKQGEADYTLSLTFGGYWMRLIPARSAPA